MQLYQIVTDRIIAELEQGAAPWLIPWRKSRANGRSVLPHNPITGHRYRGINIPILWAKQSDTRTIIIQAAANTPAATTTSPSQ
jgi:antirestriction protein ArdC